MKHFFFPLLILISPLNGQEQQDTPSIEDMTPIQKEFSNLPEDQRKEFLQNLGEASRFFQQKRIFECFEALEKADKIFDKTSELENLRGSCYVEIRAFDKALESFNKAAELDPKNSSIQFNIAEVLFVTKEWQKSHDALQKVLKEIPESNMALSRLVEFKILLCKLKLGQDDEVLILSEKYDFLDDSPYHYYAKAALSYHKEELLEAEQWLARANRIFRNPNIIAPWQDTLVEFGYIKSFYGDATITGEQ